MESSPECRNNEANMSRLNGVQSLSPPAWLPHKGHPRSAETGTEPRPVCQCVGGCVCVCVCVCVERGGEEET